MSKRVLRRCALLTVAATAVTAGRSSPAFAQVSVDPSTDGMPGAQLWQQVLGWLMQWGLWLSVAAIFLGAFMVGGPFVDD